jgi:hypothetical protein
MRMMWSLLQRTGFARVSSSHESHSLLGAACGVASDGVMGQPRGRPPSRGR